MTHFTARTHNLVKFYLVLITLFILTKNKQDQSDRSFKNKVLT